MGGLVLGAALGAAFEVLLISVVDATRKVSRFSSDLNRLESTLCSIRVVMDDVESFNEILDRPLQETEAFTARLVEGEKLIRKCSKVKKFNVIRRFYYSKKVSNLENLVLKYFQMSVAAFQIRETKRILSVVTSFEEKVNKITTMLAMTETSCEIEDGSAEGILEVDYFELREENL